MPSHNRWGGMFAASGGQHPALLAGAEFDAELERARQLQAGIPAEAGIRIPLRSRKKFLTSNSKEA